MALLWRLFNWLNTQLNRQSNVVCAFSFGDGESNRDIAQLSIEYAQRYGCFILCQWEVADKIRAIGRGDLILREIKFIEDENYMTTPVVWQRMKDITVEQEWKVCLCANEIHAIRTLILTIGIHKVAHILPSGVYDKKSSQKWTKSSIAFLWHEFSLPFLLIKSLVNRKS